MELAPKAAVTSVVAKVDVGFGNALFIRGHSNGLSWEKGTPLACVAPSVWVWSTNQAPEESVFKLLINDEIWSQGEDLSVAAGQSLEVAPVF